MLLKFRLLLIRVLSMSYKVKLLFLTHRFNSFLLYSILKKKTSNSVEALASDVVNSIPKLEFKQTTNFLYYVLAFQWSHLEQIVFITFNIIKHFFIMTTIAYPTAPAAS